MEHANATDRHAWSQQAVEAVAPGIHRIPLPLPNDGLRAVNVYAIEDGDGLTLVDAGWAIDDARDWLESGLATLGHDLGSIRRFLVTHLHRDHYSMAVAVRRELGTHVSLGIGEQASLRNLQEPPEDRGRPVLALLQRCGAEAIVERLRRHGPPPVDANAEDPDHWFEGEEWVEVAGRRLQALPTPGHTRGHVVFVDRDAGVLFSGDHVLPHITPSIGFESVPNAGALADYLESLERVRALPDLRMLPAHGPVQATTHTRVEELFVHHDERLRHCVDAVRTGASTAWQVARALTWTRRETPFDDLDGFNRLLAVTEVAAHLEVLVRRHELTVDIADGVAHHGLVARDGGQAVGIDGDA